MIFNGHINVIWRPVIEIGILWFVIYRMILFFEGTRAIQVLRGIVILVVAFFFSQILDLAVINWLLNKLFTISVLALLVIFQPEIRQGLARLGQRQVFYPVMREEEVDFMLKQISTATESLSRNKNGALIVIERIDPLSSYISTGVFIDAKVSSELIEAIFTPNNLLHDGSVIIQNGRITAAGCILPLTENPALSRIFGTRHRAALGLSEETDAIIIVVSEERQDISFVYKGRLNKDLSREELFSKVKKIMRSKNE